MLTSTDFTGNTSQNSMPTLKSPLLTDTTYDHGTPHLTTEIRHQLQVCDPRVSYSFVLADDSKWLYMSVTGCFKTTVFFPGEKVVL